MNRRTVLAATLGVLVVVLLFGSVRTTGALWADQAELAETEITTGTIGLAPGSGGDESFQFPGLYGKNLIPGDSRQAVLTITNTGSTPLEFRLATAGPSVTEGGPVTVNLSGSVADTCPESDGPLNGAFPARDTTAAGDTIGTVGHQLEPGQSTVWCIRAILVGAEEAAVFTIDFGFFAEQWRPA